MVDNQNTNVVWQARMIEQGVAQLGQAMIIVSSRGAVVFLSEAAKKIVNGNLGIGVMEGQLTAEIKTDNERMQEAIQHATQENSTTNAFGVYVHRLDRTRPIYLTISKMPKDDEERRAGCHALVLIKDLNLNQAFWADRLKDEYRLSPREMQCVTLLTEGRDLKDVATLMEIGMETVRQYMKNIYKKMSVHKQHELVSLALEYRRNR